MAIPILVIGKSGSGKSTSMRNFKKDEIGLINVLKKPLPFKGKFDSTIETDDYATIMKAIVGTEKKTIVIDDAGYLITNHFMRKHSVGGGGNSVFTLYNELGDHFWTLIEFIKTKVAPDKIVYLLMHENQDESGSIKPKTIGKLLDEKVCIEGMFTIVLRAMVDNDRHYFKTQSDGSDVCKTPIDMFEDKEIDNDLKMVDETIRKYYEMEEK